MALLVVNDGQVEESSRLLVLRKSLLEVTDGILGVLATLVVQDAKLQVRIVIVRIDLLKWNINGQQNRNHKKQSTTEM